PMESEAARRASSQRPRSPHRPSGRSSASRVTHRHSAPGRRNTPRFAHPVEQEIARIFDEHGIEWEYEPHTFVLERNGDGSVHEAFTPDFYLPELGVYVECTVMRQSLTHRKRRKARKTRGLGVN